MGRFLTLCCLLVLSGCHLIFPFNADAPPVDAAVGPDLPGALDRGADHLDGPQALEAFIPPDGPTDALKGCEPPGYKAVTIRKNVAGDWNVALEPGTTYKLVTIAGATSLEAAATADYNLNNDQVAGFIVSRAATGSLDEVSDAVATSIEGASAAIQLHAGSATTTHDGHPAVLKTIFRLSVAGPTTPSDLRNAILKTVLKKSAVSGLPGSWGASATSFTLRVSTVLRGGGRAIFVGAVTGAAADADNARLTRAVARDLTSATGLAGQSKILNPVCHTNKVTQPLTPVEIIWVMDESGSMADERASVAANAASIFAQAASFKLDFRMGVTNVCAPGQPGVCLQGKFCSVNSADSSHMGGVDRFLLPSELAIFEACVKNPPGYEYGTEYGLAAAEQAVKLHLPRTAADASKIRPGAQVVIITVTDEIDNELSNVITTEHNACTLSSSTQAQVDAVVKPHIDYLSGIVDPQARVHAYHVIGGACPAKCTANIAHGYKELVLALGGSLQDVCPTDQGPAIAAIINAIKSSASGFKLPAPPISATLRLSINGQVIPRSLTNGFDYAPLRGEIHFVGATLPQAGDTVRLSYRRWN